MINGSNIRLPNGQFSTLVTPVNKDGVTQLITPVDANGNVITGSDPSQITSETAPTTRVNPSTGLPSGGAALQIGDRWYKPTIGREGFWNGTYWVSELKTQTASISHAYTSTVNQGATGIIVDNSAYDLLLISTALRFNTAGTVSGTNYWILKLVNILFGGVVDYTYDLNVTAGDYGEITGNVYKTSPLLNQYIALTNNAIQFQIRSQSAPSSGSFTAALTYREVYR